MFSKKRIFIAIPLLWIGFVLAISFMEAWLKFQAEGVTRSIGLSIGRLVFGALNKVELFFLITLFISSFSYLKDATFKNIRMILIGVALILHLQTLYMLPFLDARVEQILKGIEPEKSKMHLYYVVLEIVKVIALISLSHQSIKKITSHEAS